jgi:predicted AAA+ superfamily ATPase
MNYIYRELLENIRSYLDDIQTKGVILSGIVGCGKTTLVQNLLEQLKDQFYIVSFSGDDIQFRNHVAEDSQYLLRQVQSQTKKRTLIFVDEVQKSEEVFDALKIAFDSKQCSFIVSGSNPAYLSLVAKKRLQRRAYQFQMLPLSLSEILVAENKISQNQQRHFPSLLQNFEMIDVAKTEDLILTSQIQNLAKIYFKFGGLPLAHLAPSNEKKLMEIRLTVERGFELFANANDSSSEKVKIELACLQSREFTYKNILEKTRILSRDTVNSTIDELINHGYLVKKKPILLKEGKSSYLSIYSYIDPGVTTYLVGEEADEAQIGFWLEGYVHARVDYYLNNSPYKSELGYYKDHTIDANGKTKFLNSGEIDFVLIRGKKILPIEVKFNSDFGLINTQFLEKFLTTHKLPFGLVIYGGIPYFDKNKKILFWPYWLI